MKLGKIRRFLVKIDDFEAELSHAKVKVFKLLELPWYSQSESQA